MTHTTHMTTTTTLDDSTVSTETPSPCKTIALSLRKFFAMKKPDSHIPETPEYEDN